MKKLNITWKVGSRKKQQMLDDSPCLEAGEGPSTLSAVDTTSLRGIELQQSQGIPRKQRSTQKSPRDIWEIMRACTPDETWTICLLVILCLQVVLCTAFQVQLSTSVSTLITNAGDEDIQDRFTGLKETSRAQYMLYAQLGTVLFETLYQVVLALNAIRTRNIVHAVGLCFTNAAVLLFTVLAGVGIDHQLASVDVNIGLNTSFTFTNGLGGVTAVLASCTLALAVFPWDFTNSLPGQAIYRHIATGEVAMRKRYLMYEIYISSLHLCFFFTLGFWVQTLSDGSWGFTLGLGVPALVAAPIALFLAGHFVRQERRIACIVNIGVLLVQPALAVCVLYFGLNDFAGTYSYVRTLVYGGFAFLAILVTIGIMIACIRNFGKGLKPYLVRHQVHSDTRSGTHAGRYTGLVDEAQDEVTNPRSTRMEID